MWFEQLTGFRESDGVPVADRIVEDGPYLKSTANGRRMHRGGFSTVSVEELRRRRDGVEPHGQTTVRDLVADVRTLHTAVSGAGATFQVASQFNMLEMVSPHVTPEAGIDRYEGDPTQGPACAIACGAGTIHRNYLVPFEESGFVVRGQTAGRQLNGLAELAAAVELDVDMRNGYAFVARDELGRVGRCLDTLSGPERDELAGLLRLGVQSDTEVTLGDAGHLVTQVFCSAFPISYSRIDATAWEPLARLVLDAAYEGTLAAATAAAARTGNGTVYLTWVGGGAFGNPRSWVFDAMRRAVNLHRTAGLDIQVVSMTPHPEVRALPEQPPSLT
jgi:hypothetical protein